MVLGCGAMCFECCLPSAGDDCACLLCCVPQCECCVPDTAERVEIASRIFKAYFSTDALHSITITSDLRIAQAKVKRGSTSFVGDLMDVKIRVTEIADRFLKQAADGGHSGAKYLWGSRLWGICRYAARYPFGTTEYYLGQKMKEAIDYIDAARQAGHPYAQAFIKRNSDLKPEHLIERERESVAFMKRQHDLSGDKRAVEREEALEKEVERCEEFLKDFQQKYLEQQDLAQPPPALPPLLAAGASGPAYRALAEVKDSR